MYNDILLDEDFIADEDFPMSDEEYQAWIEEYETLEALEADEILDILEIIESDDYQPDIDISELV